MTRTYRGVAIADMVRTIEEAMSRVIDYWGDLPAPMKDFHQAVSHPTWGGN